jgi:hypothetical protein
VLAGVAVAVIAAGVLGEYAFDGWAVIGSGVLAGLFVAEAMLAVTRTGTRLTLVVAAVLSAAAMVWAGWISTGHRLGTVAWRGWVAVAVAAMAAALRARPRGEAPDSRPAPAAAE